MVQMVQQQEEPEPKPDDLVALRKPLESLFDVLKKSASVGDCHTFQLDAVDCADQTLSDRSEVAAFTLRKIQALRYAATPGVRTTNSVIMFLAADLNLALTELAEEAEARGHSTAFSEIIKCRNQINRASKAVAVINDADVIELI